MVHACTPTILAVARSVGSSVAGETRHAIACMRGIPQPFMISVVVASLMKMPLGTCSRRYPSTLPCPHQATCGQAQLSCCSARSRID